MVPSPVVELNRAVAVAMADGPEAGLRLVDALEESGALAGYQLLAATRADLLRRLGRDHEAAAAYREALAIAVALEMRPLEARCHLGLGAVLRRGRAVLEAREHALRATGLFADLGIARWLREAEALSIELAG